MQDALIYLNIQFNSSSSQISQETINYNSKMNLQVSIQTKSKHDRQSSKFISICTKAHRFIMVMSTCPTIRLLMEQIQHANLNVGTLRGCKAWNAFANAAKICDIQQNFSVSWRQQWKSKWYLSKPERLHHQ
jgi:hypothetical protein